MQGATDATERKKRRSIKTSFSQETTLKNCSAKTDLDLPPAFTNKCFSSKSR